MSKARIFRQIVERAKPPESEYDLWLEPSGASFWLNVFKRESNEWISLGTKTVWGDILDMPDYLSTDENFNEYVNALIEAAGIADSVAFKYDGEVSQITSLPQTLEREVEGETVILPSVDATLERIIAKVWFKNMVASIAGMSDNVYIGAEVPAKKLTYSVKNFAGGEESYMRVSTNDPIMSITPEGDLTEAIGEIKLAAFTPITRKQYKVTLEAACDDADDNVNGQKQSPSCALNAYWPIWVWYSSKAATDAAAGVINANKKMLMSQTFTFSYEKGNFYYYMLLPVDFSVATQANTGDWTDKFVAINDSAYTLCSRKYKLYRTIEPVNNESNAVKVTVTVKGID